MSRLLKEYIRSVLREAVSTENLAAIKNEHWSGSGYSVVILDANVFMREIKKEMRRSKKSPFIEKVYTAASIAIVGFGNYEPPHKGQAYGGWEVTRSAGPGYGSIIYGIGYALSPNGILMPDRYSVSPKAEKVWRRAMTDHESFPLDALPPENKTDTKFDDSENLHDKEGKEYLDRAYKAQGGEKGMADELFSRGEALLDELLEITPDESDTSREYINIIDRLGNRFFSQHYR